MTVHRWLETRESPPPPALARRMRAALDAVGDTAGRPVPDVALDAALLLLAELPREPDSARSAAIGLLAADALVTYAFEAATVEPATLDELAARAMERITGVATETLR